MIYQWKSASRIKTNAQTAGEICENLERTVGLTAQNLLEVSRPEDAPLHNEFEWNDSVAAEKYRKNQARYIIRMLCVAPEKEDKPPVRAFFTVAPEQPYENIQRIMVNPEKRTSLLEMAFAEFKAFEAKYAAVSELEPVFVAFQPLKTALQTTLGATQTAAL